MATKDLTIKDARLDIRISKEQKLFFETATRLGGFRSLTDFLFFAAQEKAHEVISEREQIIASHKDGALFFDALINPKTPNKKLVKAANEFKALFS